MRQLALLMFVMIYCMGYSQPCVSDGITTEEYAARRAALTRLLDQNSAFLLKSVGAVTESDYDNYRQDRDIYYLTGCNTPGISMLIAPLGIKFGAVVKHCLIFTSDYMIDDLDFKSSANDTVLSFKQFRTIFSDVIKEIATLYYYSSEPDYHYDLLNDKAAFLGRDQKKNFESANPKIKLRKPDNLIHQLRQIKSPKELDLMRKAIHLTALGLSDAQRICKPGVYEYELQAAIEYQMKKNGAENTSFHSIIGSGLNALSPHYEKNNCQMKVGGMVVMDVGAEFHGYAADVTRTIPVSGKFTKAQAEVYNVVLNVQKELIKMAKPGTTGADIDQKSNELIRAAGYGKYILHGVTHPVGLDVHDVSSGDNLIEGMVITIEPGLYIPMDDTLLPAEYHGIGIRIEDDILLNYNGNEVITSEIPKEIPEIENNMK